jgi:hypothetical protein
LIVIITSITDVSTLKRKLRRKAGEKRNVVNDSGEAPKSTSGRMEREQEEAIV